MGGDSRRSLAVSPGSHSTPLCPTRSPSTTWGAKKEGFFGNCRTPIALSPKAPGLEERPVKQASLGKWCGKDFPQDTGKSSLELSDALPDLLLKEDWNPISGD